MASSRRGGPSEGAVYVVKPESLPWMWLVSGLCVVLCVALGVTTTMLARCDTPPADLMDTPPPAPGLLTRRPHPPPPDATYLDPHTDLQLLHLVWRHGNRAPIHVTYPTDPYLNESYVPYGRGNLIKPGYVASYELGRFLRRRYDGFLGRTLSRQLMHLQSSDKDRTRDSAALVMAGMFPPAPNHGWGTLSDDPGYAVGDLWQPFTPRVLPLQDDGICAGMDCECPALMAEVKRVKALPELASLERAVLKETPDIISYLERHAGLNLTGDRVPLRGIWDAFLAQTDFRMPLPAWSEGIFPEPLRTTAGFTYLLDSYTVLQRRLIVGALLHEIVQTSLKPPAGRRVFAYSSHDHVLMALLGALGGVDLQRPEQPPYAAVMAFELRRHKTSGELGFQIWYRNGTGQPMRQITVPNCDFFCRIDRFSELLSDTILPLEKQRKECFAADSR